LIKIPLPEILKKIESKTGMNEAEIRAKIEQKIKDLSGMVSEEGAAHIIANSLGIKLNASSLVGSGTTIATTAGDTLKITANSAGLNISHPKFVTTYIGTGTATATTSGCWHWES